jgi:peptidase E
MTVGMLLGPQRLHPIVGEALEILKVDPRDGRKIAAITAGWQEREDEDAELCAALGNRSVNLMLHARGEAVFRDDPDFFAAHRAKQDRLRSLQDLYRLRLASTLKAARRVQQATAPRDLIESELEEALQALRLLDAHHVTKVRQIEEDFERKHQAAAAHLGAPPAAEIDAVLADCSAVAIAGGHVAVLYNRMRMFDLRSRLAARPEVPIMAWSAGAMVVSERIVLFHDSPPQGRGNAEMLGPGLGLFPDVVVLPHARRRLLLSDHARISVFARRHATAACYALDDRNWIRFDGARWHSGPGTYQLCSDGQLVTTSLTPSGPRFGHSFGLHHEVRDPDLPVQGSPRRGSDRRLPRGPQHLPHHRGPPGHLRLSRPRRRREPAPLGVRPRLVAALRARRRAPTSGTTRSRSRRSPASNTSWRSSRPTAASGFRTP